MPEYRLLMFHDSRTVSKVPCHVKSITVTGDGAAGYIHVYDGDSDQMEHKLFIKTASDRTHNWTCREGIRFDRGLHITVNADTTYAMVIFKPLNKSPGSQSFVEAEASAEEQPAAT